MYGDFPANNTVYTPYIPIYVWFWPTLRVLLIGRLLEVRAARASRRPAALGEERY
jgi:hypothetical protein